jgi:hypothetical protein
MVKVSTLLFQLVKTIWWVKLKSRIRVVNNTVFYFIWDMYQAAVETVNWLLLDSLSIDQSVSQSASYSISSYKIKGGVLRSLPFYVASIILHCHSNCGYIHTCHFLKKLFDTICGRSLTSCSNSFYHVKNTLTSVHFMSSEYVHFH